MDSLKPFKAGIPVCIVIIGILFFSILTSCANGMIWIHYGRSPSPDVSLRLLNEDGIESEIFNENEAVTFELTVKNISASPVVFKFSDSQQYDFEVYNKNSELIWRWSQDRVFSAILTEFTLRRNESRTFFETWNQETDKGFPAGAGNYEAEGVITSTPISYGSGERNFTIR